MLKIRGLTKTYVKGTAPVLGPVDLTLPDRGLVAIRGKSGSGKSTFLRIVGSMDLDYEGSVTFDQTEYRSCTAKELAKLRFSAIGYAFQDDEFDLSQTVRSSLSWPLEIADIPEAEKELLIANALALVGLEAKIGDKVANLSGGERKRVGVARALLLNPRLILLDEPLASCDKETRRALTSLFCRLADGALVVVVTHTPEPIPGALLLSCRDGKLQIEKDGCIPDNEKTKEPLARGRYHFRSALKRALHAHRRKGTRTVLALSALTLALSSFGLSSMIADGLGRAVTEVLTGAIDAYSLTVAKDSNVTIDDALRGVPLSVAQNMRDEFGSYIQGYGHTYIEPTDGLFTTRDESTIKVGEKGFRIPGLRADDYLNPVRTYELDTNLSLTAPDSVILGLRANDLSALDTFLKVPVAEYIRDRPLLLSWEVAENDMSYETENVFRIVGVVETPRAAIVVSDPDFNRHLVEEELKLEPLDTVETAPLKPWQIRRTSFVSVRPDDFLSFYESFLASAPYGGFLLERDRLQDEYQNRFNLLAEALDSLKASELQAVAGALGINADSYSYSNSLFGYVAGGRWNGFMRPVFLAREREPLNALADANYQSVADLNSFQSSSFEIPSAVFTCDLLSAVGGKGITFKAYLDPPVLTAGRLPTTDTEIVLSSGLAGAIYGTLYEALYAALPGTVLRETVASDGGYVNRFLDVDFRVVGIVDDVDLALYQSPAFPTAFMLNRLAVPAESARLTGGIIECREDLNRERALAELSEAFPTLLFDFPGQVIEDGINEALELVKTALLIFASFTAFVALMMLLLLIYLFIREDGKAIGLYLLHGFRKGEIGQYYCTLVLTVISAAWVFAAGSVIIAGYVCQRELEIQLGSTAGLLTVKPFFLMTVMACAAILLSSLYTLFSLRSSSPLAALKK